MRLLDKKLFNVYQKNPQVLMTDGIENDNINPSNAVSTAVWIMCKKNILSTDKKTKFW